eukprot:XP_766328.1 hypothetical protein [Theileria parva strain Muguga]
MSSFRRDQIPVVVSAFMNFVWAFSSFLSVDMVKLLLFAFWSHLFALNLIATLYLASYNIGGINGLVMGAASAYFFGYLLLHGVERPSDFSIASRKTTCNWDYLEYYFYFEYNDSVNRVTMENLFKWFDGQEVDLMTTVHLSPSCYVHISINDLRHYF